MRMATMVVQVLITLVVTALVMPVWIVRIPAAREGRFGLALMGGTALIVFVILRLIWPRRRA